MRRLLLFLVLALAAVALAAHLTRPGRAELDAAIGTALRDRIAAAEIGSGDDPLRAAAVAACKLEAGSCAELLRDLLSVRLDRGLFVTRATVEGLGLRARCTGAFFRFACRKEGGP